MTIKLFDRAKLPSRISSDNEIKQEIQLTKVNSKGKTTGCFWMPAGSHDGFVHKPWTGILLIYAEFMQRTSLGVRHSLQLISWTSEKNKGG